MRLRVHEMLASTLYPITCLCNVDLGAVFADVFLQSRPRRCMRSCVLAVFSSVPYLQYLGVPEVLTPAVYALTSSCSVYLGNVCAHVFL